MWTPGGWGSPVPPPAGPFQGAGGRCLSPTVSPDSVTAQSLQPLERPERVRASKGKQAVKYFKTWYFTRNGPSEGPKIHSSVFALKRVGGPALGLVARSSPCQQGKGKQLGCVWGDLTKGFSDWGWRRREGRGCGYQLPWALPANSVETLGLSCELRGEPPREFPNNNNNNNSSQFL